MFRQILSALMIALTAGSAAGQKFSILVTLKPTDPPASITIDDALTALGGFPAWDLGAGTMPQEVPATSVAFGRRLIHNPFDNSVQWAHALNRLPSGELQFAVDLQIVTSDGQAQEKVATVLAERFRAIVTADNPMPAEQRAARLIQLDGQIAQLDRQADALQKLKWANEQDSPNFRIKDRLKKLRDDLQRIETELAAKQARQEALQVGLRRQEARLRQQQQADPILEELQKIVKAKEDVLARQQNARGQFSAAEIQTAEMAVAEAKIRLLERQEVTNKAGKGELLDRMADESAMIAVDVTELELKRDTTKRQLGLLNPAAIEAGKIDDVLAENPELRADSSDKAVKRVQDELNKAIRERFVLLVDDVTVKLAE